MDSEKVIEGLRRCTEKAVPDCFGCPYSCHCEEGDTWVIKDDALVLLQEQEHKDRMYHALEDDWKRLKELLKEQEAVRPTWGRGKPFCGACGLRIRGGKFCSECGKPIAWEGQ